MESPIIILLLVGVRVQRCLKPPWSWRVYRGSGRGVLVRAAVIPKEGLALLRVRVGRVVRDMRGGQVTEVGVGAV